MPAPLGEDAGAAADAARFGQTPGEEARSLENRPASGRACLEPRMSFASLRLGPRVPAARAPHARPPPCYLRLARVMKAPPRPLSQKRAAEGLQGRVRRARVYVLSPAAGAARRSTPLPLRDHEPP
jgi:hypothetical protein